jgi:hypothetical protein
MNEILRKLSSRKLWLALAGIATGIAMVLGADSNDISTVAGAMTAIASVVTYIITEGRIDAEGVKNAIIEIQDGFETIEGADGDA